MLGRLRRTPILILLLVLGLFVVWGVYNYSQRICCAREYYLELSEVDDGENITIRMDDIVKVTLDGIDWQFEEVSNPDVVKRLNSPKKDEGKISVDYQAVHQGQSEIRAKRQEEDFKVTINVGPVMEDQNNTDLHNLKVVYSYDNGSLPPDSHRQYEFNITTDNKGEIKSEYTLSDYNVHTLQEVNDYKNVLEKRPFTFSWEQLSRLINASKKVNSKSDDSINSGCSGGSNRSIKIAQKDELLLEATSYNCDGKSTNESLEEFSAEFAGILANSK